MEGTTVVAQVAVVGCQGMMYAQPVIVSIWRQYRQLCFKADDLQPGVRRWPADRVQHRSRSISIFRGIGRVEHRGKELLGDGRIASSPDMEGQQQTPPIADRA